MTKMKSILNIIGDNHVDDDDRDEHGNIEGKDFDNDEDDIENSVNDVDNDRKGGH